MTKSSNVLYRAVDAVVRGVLRRAPSTAWTESVALNWGYRYRPVPGIVTLRSGARIQLSHVDHLQLLLYYLGTFEPRALEFMRRSVKPGATILDVGANIGLFTVEGALSVGPSGKVISIEASPNHAKHVSATAKLNGMENVEVAAVAVGNYEGEATLTLPKDANYGMFTLGGVAGDESFTVSVRRIDDIVGGERVDFIKMDIEGSEYGALLGALETIKRSKPIILIELNEAALVACGATSRQVKDLLESLGYKGRLLDGTPIAPNTAHVCDECIFTAGH